jgi:hypothetical protein
LAIVTLVLWVVTATAGVSLLSTGGAARRLAGRTGGTGCTGGTGGTGRTVSTTARSAAIPLTAEGKPPPVPHAKVTTPPGEHPLLEFSHPALALIGVACWFMFVFVHYHPLAWISFGILVVTLGAGLGWLVRNRQAARLHVSAAWAFPRQLIVLHGLAAALAISLTVLTALSASHG